MASSYEIRCINKSDRTNIHERITSIGGLNQEGTRWKIGQQNAIDGIEKGDWKFYLGQGQNKVDVIIAVSAAGYKYLKTQNDTTTTNNLLNLPEYP